MNYSTDAFADFEAELAAAAASRDAAWKHAEALIAENMQLREAGDALADALRDVTAEHQKYRKVLIRIGNAESGIWGKFAREALKEERS